MLYFAYGSNLNHYQMTKIRCIDSKYVKNYFLKNYKLSFCHPNKLNKFGYANVIKKRGSVVAGAIWNITKEHEKILDGYEGFPITYQKEYFYFNGKKTMFYLMSKYFYKSPPSSYIDTIDEGYKNCKLDKKYLNKAMNSF